MAKVQQRLDQQMCSTYYLARGPAVCCLLPPLLLLPRLLLALYLRL